MLCCAGKTAMYIQPKMADMEVAILVGLKLYSSLGLGKKFLNLFRISFEICQAKSETYAEKNFRKHLLPDPL
jgi:hypothetical protein